LSPTSTTALLKALDTNFALKDLGELHFFLGIEITKNAAGLLLSQGKNAEDLLKRAGMTTCKPINTPLRGCQRTRVLSLDLMTQQAITVSWAAFNI
jgi:hypothetical protein